MEEAHQDHNHSHTNYFEAIPVQGEVQKLVFNCGHHTGPTVIDIPKRPPAVTIKAPEDGMIFTRFDGHGVMRQVATVHICWD